MGAISAGVIVAEVVVTSRRPFTSLECSRYYGGVCPPAGFLREHLGEMSQFGGIFMVASRLSGIEGAVNRGR